ncbi:hypothetical protein RRG08_060696 [Elysia crispata]|uniref:Uncharacterized protein n=1 Tax=Elysia crispata TaxID=231223 RepID=A0AAE0YSC9_9GAST|nr:hypothetical protein RRG08_060696 [Elysia crispata]
MWCGAPYTPRLAVHIAELTQPSPQDRSLFTKMPNLFLDVLWVAGILSLDLGQTSTDQGPEDVRWVTGILSLDLGQTSTDQGRENGHNWNPERFGKLLESPLNKHRRGRFEIEASQTEIRAGMASDFGGSVIGRRNKWTKNWWT